MPNKYHRNLIGHNNHAVTANPDDVVTGYTDIAARDADTVFNTDPLNINKCVRVESPLSYWVLTSVVPAWLEFTVTGSDSFLDLTDTPASYAGEAGKVLQVNATPDGVEFGQILGTQTDIALNTTHRSSDGTDHANVALNDTHRGSAGIDHSDVVLNNAHRISDGKNHSDVVLNNTHRSSDGSDHSFLDQSVVSGASPLFTTQTPGDDSTKAATTEYVDDAVAAVSIPDISCKVERSTTQSIPDATPTIIDWNTEAYDTDGMHDNATNNSRITIKTAGKYLFSCYGGWTNNSTGERQIDFLMNGSTTMARTRYLPTDKSENTASFVGDFAVNDYVEIEVTQDSGGSLNWSSGQRHFAAHKIG